MSIPSPPSPLAGFRCVSLLACLVLAAQRWILLWPAGEAGPAHLRDRLALLAGAGLGRDGLLTAYALGFALFAWALWRATANGPRAPDHAAKLVLLAVQIALALLLHDKLLLLTAAEAALLLGRRLAACCLGAQLLLTLLANAWQAQYLPANELICNVSGSQVALPDLAQRRWQLGLDAALGGGFQLLTFGIGCLGRAERRRRAELEATRASLLAAGQLLAGAAGNGERLRLARELHDGIGHHLSALNLQLELLLRRGAGGADPPLRAAQQSARSMLAEVRALVGKERQAREAPLNQALRLLCEGMAPAVGLQLEPLPGLSDAAAWRALRAAREALADRGGQPCRLWLAQADDGGAELRLSQAGAETWATIWREAA